MDTNEIAKAVVAFCKAGTPEKVGQFQADDIVSVEAMAPPGMETSARGKAALEGKAQWWRDNHEITSSEVTGPFVNGEQFAVHFTMDVVVKATGQQMHMTEVGLYTVRGGKIVEERFFYGG